MEWNHVVKHVSELIPQEKNPRTLSKKQREQLSASIQNFGCAQPLVIAIDGTIIGGHQRYLVMKSKGIKEIDCMQASEEMTQSQIDELTIRLNKNTGDFDFDLLANGYEPDLLLNWGFSMEELHLESIPEQEKPKTFSLSAKFENEDDLRDAEKEIADIIVKYSQATYKVKVK